MTTNKALNNGIGVVAGRYGLRVVYFIMLSILCVMVHAVPAGSRIENQASATFVNITQNVSEEITSQRVVAVVQSSFQLALEQSLDDVVMPGVQVLLPHRLRNSGNQDNTVTLTLEVQSSNALDTAVSSLWLDRNDNGVIDSGDTEVGVNYVVSLSAQQELSLLTVVSVPDSVQEGDEYQFVLRAQGEQDSFASATDRLIVSLMAATEVSVLSTLSNNNVQTSNNISIETRLSFDGTNPLEGIDVMVDGQIQSFVLVETALPAGIFLAEPVVAPEGYTVLYRISGNTGDTYTTIPPDDLERVASVAFARTILPVTEPPVFTIPLMVQGEARTTILQTSVRYADATITSDMVELTITASDDPEADSLMLLVNGDTSTADDPMTLVSGGNLDITFDCASCDANADGYDTVTVQVVSDKTGDIETITLSETDLRSGHFSSNLLGLSSINDGAAVDGDGQVTVSRNDWITITIILSNGETFELRLLIDPAGYIFDSVTGNVIANAEVTLYRVASDGSLLLAEVFADALGTISSPNPFVSDNEGYYEFPYVEPGDYQLFVSRVPPGFTFPSQRSGADMTDIIDLYENFQGFDDNDNIVNDSRATVAQGPSYGGLFQVVDDAVYIDIPLDPDYVFVDSSDGNKGLLINLAADTREAMIGDAVGYTADVTNLSGNSITGTELRVGLPLGLQFLPDSATLNGESITPSEIVDGQLVFSLADMSAEEEASLVFYLVVTPSSMGSNHTVTAQAFANAQMQAIESVEYFSRKAHVKIDINDGVFTTDGLIIGKVFYDCDADGLQNRSGYVSSHEVGVQGIRLYLQNGRYVETDAQGRFSFPRLRTGSYLVKVDRSQAAQSHSTKESGGQHDGEPDQSDNTQRTLKSWALTKRTSRYGHQGDLVRVDLSDGEMFRVDFPLVCDSFVDAGYVVDTLIETVVSENNGMTEDSNSTVGIIAELDPAPEDKTPTLAENPGLILSPTQGQRITSGQTRIDIEGPLHVVFDVLVNGVPLDAGRLGEQTIDEVAGKQSLTYYAVDLMAGENSIVAVAKDTWGNERARDEITVIQPGEFHHLVWPQRTQALEADSQIHTVDLELHDAHGVRIGGDALITLDIVEGNTLGMTLEDTDLDALVPGMQRLAKDGHLAIALKSPQREGSVRLEASMGNHIAESKLEFTPKQQSWVVAGMFESDLSGYTGKGGDLDASSEHPSMFGRIERDSTTWDDGQNRLATRGMVFAKGTVKQDYLVTLIADTDKRDEDDWAGRIDLDSDYPIYGDDALHGAEGEASKGLYLRVEKGDSFGLIGDFRVSQDNRRTQYGTYNRKLYGIQHRYEGDQWQVESFMAQTETTQGVDIIRARGTSGPFVLSKYPIVTNSETVDIITRSRAPDGNIIAVEPLTPFIDYEIDPVLGSVILRSPLSGSDAQGRPRYLRIQYEVDDDNAVENDTFGTDITYRPTEQIALGVRTLVEKNDINDYTLSSVNGLYQITKSTAFVMEYAQSENSGLNENNKGHAVIAHIEHSSERRDISLKANEASDDFDNASASVVAATQTIQFRWNEHVSAKSNIWLSSQAFTNTQTNVDSQSQELGATYRLSDQLNLGASVQHTQSENQTGDEYSDTSVGLHSRYQPKWMPALTVDARAYQATGTHRQRQQIRTDYQLPRQGSMYITWDNLSGYDVNGDISESDSSIQKWSAGYKQKIHSTTELYSEYRLDDAADGFESSAATGMRFGYDIKKGLRLTAQTERTMDLSDNPTSPARHSWALGLSGFDADDSKWSARIEMLEADESRWLQEASWAKRLNKSWSVLMKERLQWNNSLSDYAANVIGGVAYRPAYTNRWDWLGSFDISDGLSERYTIDPDVSRISIRNNVNVRLARAWTLSGGLALQKTIDDSEIDYTSLAWLTRARLRYEFSDTWSAGVLGSYFTEEQFKSGAYSGGFELQRTLGKNFFIGVRFQHFGYENGGIDSDSVYRRGLSLQFGGTFDENSLSGLLSRLE